MKAVVFHGPEVGLKVEEVDLPKVGPGEILVKVAACGVCHSDLHYLEGLPTFKKPPLILGHEASGTVEEVGPEVTDFKKGDRVLFPATTSCGVCALCRMGRENICSAQKMFGNDIDGSYAQFVKGPAKDAIRLPEEIPLVEGCVISDAISTPFHAVKNRAEVKPGDVVVVFGCGGVGINIVQLASAVGGSVIAVDVSDKKLDWARKFGASATVNPSGIDISKEIRRMTAGGADIAIEAIGKPETIQQAYESVRVGGRLVVVGYCSKNITINPARLMYREVEIRGSLGCRAVDYPKIMEMVKLGKIDIKGVITHRMPLDEINTAFDLMRKGESLRSIVLPN